MARIKWGPGLLGSSSVESPNGEVDGVRLFSLYWQGDAGGKRPPYAISTDLPGIKVNPAVTPEEARARCERVLERWLRRMLEADADKP